MKSQISGALALALLAGCAQGPTRVSDFEERRDSEGHMEMGPPPPGYWRILGDAVPGWTPESMHASPDGPGAWMLLGPRPMTNEYWSGNANAGGRVAGIAVSPSSASTVYIATASGGVWKSTDAGVNWAAMTDELSNLNCGAIAIDPSNHNTVYLGTGEYVTSSGGDGLFRSTDAGVSWTRIATTAQVGSNISRIAIDPTNPQVIHVTGSSGYIRSTTGGSSWSTRLSGTCSDLALDPVNPQRLYVGRHNDGVYRSLDGGGILTELSSGIPSSGMTRIILAISRSNPQVLYATLINSSSGLLGEYRTANGGDSWTLLAATPDFPSPQGWYDCCMAVDPANENIAYGGGVFPTYAVAGIIKTTNGGASWTDITTPAGGGQVHPDMQTMAFGPDGTLWVGCDGGVWKTTNGGTSWINCNATLAATQHYQIALHPTDQNRVIGGTQDNGTAQRTSASASWPQALAGDGGFCCYDFVTPTRRYVTYVYLTVYRQSPTTEITGPWGADPADFIAPLVMDPNSATTLLGGTNRVWRTANATLTPPTWTAISGPVTGGGSLSALAVARGASNTIYTGSNAGRVFVTTDASIWNDRSAGLPGGTISDVVISPTAPGTAYVGISSTSGSRILRTDTFGTAWSNKTGTLPAGVRAKAIEIDWRSTPPVMYVGTGAGIYWSFDDGATWTKDGPDFPNVNIGDLQIDRTNNTITAGTYGRGVWRAALFSATPAGCYANCDGSTTVPVLNVADFSCFLNRFAAGESYANCDNSTVEPVLNIGDFSCFLNQFAAGCT